MTISRLFTNAALKDDAIRGTTRDDAEVFEDAARVEAGVSCTV